MASGRRLSSSDTSMKASAVKSAKKAPRTLEDLLALNQPELQSYGKDLGLTVSTLRSEVKQSELLVQILAAKGLDPKIQLDSLINTVTTAQLYKAATEAASFQQHTVEQYSKVVEVVDSLSSASGALQRVQAELDDQRGLLKDCRAELLEQTQQMSSMRTEMQQLRKDQSRSGFAAAAAEGSSESEQMPVLRLTGLREEKDEDSESLLAKVAEVLETLPCNVAPSDAIRQGQSDPRKCRAVIVTFANACDRDLVLRRKWCLSKQVSTRQLGINEVLTPQQQSQKNALWSTYQQARAQGHRASFRGGCLLYINDQPWDLPGQQQQLGQVAEQYFSPMPCPPPQQPPQMLHELSGPSQTLHMNPSQQPFADAPQMLPVLQSLPTQSISVQSLPSQNIPVQQSQFHTHTPCQNASWFQPQRPHPLPVPVQQTPRRQGPPHTPQFHRMA